MGWYTNYEVEFDKIIDWDDNDVKRCLKPFNVEYLYLRDMNKPRVILCVYSHNPVKSILIALKGLYSTGMRYRVYNSDEAWIVFTLMKSTERFTKIEETGIFENDIPHEEFANHFYKTRYDRFAGLLMTTPEELRSEIKKTIYDATGKNQYELPLLEKEGKNAMAWSMNWYRLRTPDNKTYHLTDDDKATIVSEFVEISKTSPLKTTIHIFQREGTDALLIAVSFILE